MPQLSNNKQSEANPPTDKNYFATRNNKLSFNNRLLATLFEEVLENKTRSIYRDSKVAVKLVKRLFNPWHGSFRSGFNLMLLAD